MFEVLQTIKNELSKIDTIKSLKIGFEKGADVSSNCPLVRIVPEGSEAFGNTETLTVQIVVAFDLKNDIETLYQEFYALEKTIKDSMNHIPYRTLHLDTIMDEDMLKSLKAGIVRFNITHLGLN